MKLKRFEMRRVENWLVDHWDDIEKRKLTKAAIAAEVGKELSLVVSVGHINGAAEGIGKTWPRWTGKMATKPKIGRRQFEIVVAAIAHIYNEAGVNVLPDFAELVSTLADARVRMQAATLGTKPQPQEPEQRIC